MKVLAHLDPVVLERTLLDELASGHTVDGQAGPDANGPAATLVIVPTRRLAGHVQQRLLERRPAWLGLEVLHFHALVQRILVEAGVPAPRFLSPSLTEAVLRKVLLRHPENRWCRYVKDRPGALSGLAASLRDLREAGRTAAGVIETATDDAGGRDLASLYRGFCDELERLRGEGWYDESGAVELALPHAEAFAAKRRGVWLHGAYELIGLHTRLVLALDRGREVRVLFPYDATAPVGRYAGQFLERHLAGAGAEVEAIPSNGKRFALGALYDEEARPAPAESPRIAYRSAQGAAAEIKGAVRAALAAVGKGCPPREIVIAARSLTPYEAALDEVLEQEGLPWTGSLSQPLRNHPAVHDFALLVAVLDEGFPRRGTAELLRSPRIRWEKFATAGEAPHGEQADRWSRAAGVVGGLDEWRDLLVEWAGRTRRGEEHSPEERERDAERAARRVQEARNLAGALECLHERAQPDEARRWSAHADALEALVEEAFDTEDEVWDDVAALLAEMRSLETIVGDTGAVRFPEMRQWLETAIDRTEREPHRRDNGGIRVLDMMQLRGVTCRHLFLVGMNSGVLPRPPRPDPLLPDDLRKALGGPLTPLPLKREGPDEERLLLCLTLGAASESIELTWQRADEAGRGRTRSLALRETRRLSHGSPDIAADSLGASWHPSHPTSALEWLERTVGMLSAREERLLTALHSLGQPEILGEWYPELAAGLNLLRATESFEPVDPRFDGRVGASDPAARPLSVSALETLAGCPLKFFFQRVLRVRELDEEAEPFEPTPLELGSCAHELLEKTYSVLRAEELFERPLEQRVKRAQEILDESWEPAWHALKRRLDRRAPALWASLRASWRGALGRFVAEDLDRIEARGWGAPDTERVIDKEVAFGDGRALQLIGRVDRAFRTGERAGIGDYKTGRVKDLNNVTAMLKGRALQVPLYWMLAGAEAEVEVLGVGPRHDPAEVDAAERIFPFNGLEDEELRGFLETMRVLVDLIGEGVYPLKHDDVACGYCPYELSCRHRHPPTLEREEHAADRADFADLERKNKSRKPTLAAVRSER